MVKWGKLPDLHTMNAIVAHWDIAYAGTDTSDFNACKIWGRHKNDFWLIDGFVKQSKMKLCVQWMCMKQAEFRAKGIICFGNMRVNSGMMKLNGTLRKLKRKRGWSLIWFQYKLPKR